MVGKYKAYPEYKDSGVKWLGKIPSNWSVIPLKRYFSIINGSTPKAGNDNFWNGDIIWITPSDLSKLTSFDIINSTRKITKSGLASCGTSIVPINSIILSCRAPIGSIGLAKVELCTNQGCKSLVPFQDSSSYFYAYVLSICTEELNAKGKGTTFLELSNDELGYFSLPKPTIKEQRNIVIFLDYETHKIDTLIKQQQQLIKLLEEKRQAVISHAVTKGLNPNVPMKDSGVEWLGEIPEHWQTVAIGRLFDRVKRTGYAEKELLSVYRDYGVIPKSSRDDNFNKSSQDLSSYQLVNPNDLVINKMKTWQGSIAISNYEGIVSPAYFIFKPNKKMYSHFITKYIHYLLRTPIYVSQYLARSKGIRVNQWDLDPEEFRKIKLVIPTKNEQLQSIEYIEKYEEKINKLISKAIQQINLLKERRTALISAAVTGKIDVRDWQAPTVTD